MNSSWDLMLLVLFGTGIIFVWPQEEPIVTPKEAVELNELHPVVDEKKQELIQRAEAQGISVVITEGYRSHEEQDGLYAQGREEPGSIVTNAKGGESYHNYGLAIDFAIEKPNGEITWDIDYDGNHNGRSDWEDVSKIAKELGFEWGGDWPGFRDYSHLQLETDVSMYELQQAEKQR
ncbi:peptidoglycan L-alanyl-D-glutamate endopeptidase CwlK [Alteribacillus persepolensis]|uniref:Peptidoglycan L-alanyl-D-glutamate endopeptidase CwlK n=1 Tax=Alteribacillus persepolensis TaxID=568899 RepID=A0A1G8IPA7_9BACI|nr:M15 family metallopeptidase [Alteribacillus persepolensis]SDI20755.1 peptidoglycan L-alanyl-D-glutamate endopeptidase CwlK [Alteribacillus persepolensis]